MKFFINNLDELDDYLHSQNTNNCNLVNYAWMEYGFLPIYFNEFFTEFFKASGKFIGVCFQGHEILYEDKVDDLLVLVDFINTSRAYIDNKETELLIENFKKYDDRGIAFWETLKNFDENAYSKIIEKYTIKNVLHSMGNRFAWEHRLPYKYATGEKDYYTPRDCLLIKEEFAGWSNVYNYTFPKIINCEEYYTIFVKNSWKSRNYRSRDINDFLSSSNTRYLGSIDNDFYKDIINYFISTNKKLVVISDLIQHDIPKHENIIIYNMKNYFDIYTFCCLVHNSKMFLTVPISMFDIALFYCNTHILMLDTIYKKYEFGNKVLGLKNKKCLKYESNINDLIEKINSV